MRDPRLDRLASVLVGYSTQVRPGDIVEIISEPIALPLIEAIVEQVLRAGGHPSWRVRSEAIEEILLRDGNEEQLRFLSPLERQRVETIDVHIGIWAEINTRYLARVEPARVAMNRAARRPVTTRFMQRAAEGKLRWVGTQFPTLAAAQDAEMSLADYENFVFSAGMLHDPEPAAAWARVHERQERVRAFLQGRKEVHFHVPPHDGHDGTDLRVSVDGATWINCSGRENFPDGEVFAGPRGADGHVNYTFPAVYGGREVEGVRLKFRDGRVVDASARKNEKFLIEMLDQDAGARNLGEIAVGTNYAIKDFSRNTLFDEKIGGTFHAAVGAGYPESGNTNESGLHWDMVCDLRPGPRHPGGTIHADGELVQRDGVFAHAGWPGRDD